ncbi:MAG: hypothetical protein WCT99_11165 [Bacteroidota bacterium]
MKKIFLILPLLLAACGDSAKIHQLQEQIDNLEVQSANSYKPGFGEFMSGIQIHHAKLWFAGKNRNWDLARFELGEIGETVDAIQKYQKERKESESLPLLAPALDTLRTAVDRHDVNLFVKSFTALTNTCNSCHRSVKFGFNVVTIPSSPPFSNQDFSVRNN